MHTSRPLRSPIPVVSNFSRYKYLLLLAPTAAVSCEDAEILQQRAWAGRPIEGMRGVRIAEKIGKEQSRVD